MPDRLQDLLHLWKYQPPWFLDEFDRLEEVFPAASYQYVLYGMGFRTEVDPDDNEPTEDLAAAQAERKCGHDPQAARATCPRTAICCARSTSMGCSPSDITWPTSSPSTPRIIAPCAWRRPRRRAMATISASCRWSWESFPISSPTIRILFSKDAETGGFYCGAMLGIDEGENLFLTEGRSFDAYRPLNLQRGPFFTAGSDIAIDLDHPRVGRERAGAVRPTMAGRRLICKASSTCSAT